MDIMEVKTAVIPASQMTAPTIITTIANILSVFVMTGTEP
jgi:hypothetical protein